MPGNSSGDTVTNSGTNTQGNHWCTRQDSEGRHGYHYSNGNGSYYYKNPNGSKYFNDGKGNYKYTSPGGYVRTSSGN